jgi:hypothetical protein
MSSDASISHEALRSLEGPYQAVASSSDFAALSGFERWLRLRERIAQTPGLIDQHELTVLDALDVALKAQLLDWLEHRREAASVARQGRLSPIISVLGRRVRQLTLVVHPTLFDHLALLPSPDRAAVRVTVSNLDR